MAKLTSALDRTMADLGIAFRSSRFQVKIPPNTALVPKGLSKRGQVTTSAQGSTTLHFELTPDHVSITPSRPLTIEPRGFGSSLVKIVTWHGFSYRFADDEWSIDVRVAKGDQSFHRLFDPTDYIRSATAKLQRKLDGSAPLAAPTSSVHECEEWNEYYCLGQSKPAPVAVRADPGALGTVVDRAMAGDFPDMPLVKAKAQSWIQQISAAKGTIAGAVLKTAMRTREWKGELAITLTDGYRVETPRGIFAIPPGSPLTIRVWATPARPCVGCTGDVNPSRLVVLAAEVSGTRIMRILENGKTGLAIGFHTVHWRPGPNGPLVVIDSQSVSYQGSDPKRPYKYPNTQYGNAAAALNVAHQGAHIGNLSSQGVPFDQLPTQLQKGPYYPHLAEAAGADPRRYARLSQGEKLDVNRFVFENITPLASGGTFEEAATFVTSALLGRFRHVQDDPTLGPVTEKVVEPLLAKMGIPHGGLEGELEKRLVGIYANYAAAFGAVKPLLDFGPLFGKGRFEQYMVDLAHVPAPLHQSNDRMASRLNKLVPLDGRTSRLAPDDDALNAGISVAALFLAAPAVKKWIDDTADVVVAAADKVGDTANKLASTGRGLATTGRRMAQAGKPFVQLAQQAKGALGGSAKPGTAQDPLIAETRAAMLTTGEGLKRLNAEVALVQGDLAP